jgi:hypothetical protein
VAKEEPKAPEPTPPPAVAKEEPKAPEPAAPKPEEAKPAETPTPAPKAEQVETPKAKVYDSPGDLMKAIVEALHGKDKDALKALALSEDELAKSVGESRVARVRKGILSQIEADYGRLAADEPAVFRGTYVESPASEVGHEKLVKNDDSVAEVQLVRKPTLAYEVDGVRKTTTLGQLVKVGDGGWKILSLLPKR